MFKLTKEKNKIPAQKIVSIGVEEGHCNIAVFDAKASKVDSWSNEIKEEFRHVKSTTKRAKVIWCKKSPAKKTEVPHAFSSKIFF